MRPKTWLSLLVPELKKKIENIKSLNYSFVYDINIYKRRWIKSILQCKETTKATFAKKQARSFFRKTGLMEKVTRCLDSVFSIKTQIP